MLILVPFKPVAIVLGFLSALIFCSYFASCWIEHKDPFQIGRAAHVIRAKTIAHPVPPHKHSYKAAPTASE